MNKLDVIKSRVALIQAQHKYCEMHYSGYMGSLDFVSDHLGKIEQKRIDELMNGLLELSDQTLTSGEVIGIIMRKCAPALIAAGTAVACALDEIETEVPSRIDELASTADSELKNQKECAA